MNNQNSSPWLTQQVSFPYSISHSTNSINDYSTVISPQGGPSNLNIPPQLPHPHRPPSWVNEWFIIVQRNRLLEQELMELQTVKQRLTHFEQLFWDSRNFCGKLETENKILKNELKTLRGSCPKNILSFPSTSLFPANLHIDPCRGNQHMTDMKMTPRLTPCSNEVNEETAKIIFTPNHCSTLLPQLQPSNIPVTKSLTSGQPALETQTSRDLFEVSEEEEGSSDEEESTEFSCVKVNRTMIWRRNKEKIQWTGVSTKTFQDGGKNGREDSDLKIINGLEDSEKNGEETKDIFVLVKLETEWKKGGTRKRAKMNTRHFVVKVKGEVGMSSGKKIYLVDYCKKASLHGNRFLINENELDFIVERDDVVCLLPSPTIRRRGFIQFPFDFSRYFLHF